MKVAALVINSVRNDRRVIRQALGLARAGHDVTVIGIRDNRAALAREQLALRCEIIRVPWRTRLERIYMALWFIIAAAALLVLTSALLQPFRSHERLLVDKVFNMLVRARGLLFNYPDRVFIIAASTALLALALRRFVAAKRRYWIYMKLEGEALPKSFLCSFSELVHACYVVVTRRIRLGVIQHSVLAGLKRIRPDVVHCHDLLTLPIGVAYKKSHGCHLIYDSHEIFEESSSTGSCLSMYYRYLQSFYSAQVDAFITVNDSLAAVLNDRYPLLPPALVVKNAADSVTTDGRDYDGRLHQRAGVSPGKKILLYQGGFSAGRGLEELVASAADLPADWHVVLMGWGKLEKILRNAADSTGTDEKRVSIIPPVPPRDLTSWTSGAAVGIIPYENTCLNHWYCTPNKLWEYPSAGVPVLVSPLYELERVIAEYGIGWVLRPCPNRESIVSAVSALSDREIEEKRRNCPGFVARDNWRLYEKRLLDLYEHIRPVTMAGTV